jgi:hypothetical protein
MFLHINENFSMEILKYSLLSESFVLSRSHCQFLSVGLSMKHIQSCICGVLLYQVQWDICNQISHQTYLLKWHHLYHETGNAKDRTCWSMCHITNGQDDENGSAFSTQI